MHYSNNKKKDTIFLTLLLTFILIQNIHSTKTNKKIELKSEKNSNKNLSQKTTKTTETEKSEKTSKTSKTQKTSNFSSPQFAQIDAKLKMQTKTKQIFSKMTLSPVQAFLSAVAIHKEQGFCIKQVHGAPQQYRSYTCPLNMKIMDDSLTTCQKDCPKGMQQEISNCEKPCEKDYQKENSFCLNTITKNRYPIVSIPLEKSDPICINGYFLNGFCHSCMGHTDYSNGQCLSPCTKGAPSESFCAFKDDANKDLSVINHYWADFLRIFYKNLFDLFKTGYLKRQLYANVKNLNDIAEIITKNKSDIKIENDCGKVMIFMRDKFGVNMPDAKQFLRNIFFKMFSRYAQENKENSNDVLNVVDDLINFNGGYKSPYLDTKQYGIVSLPLTVANLMQHLCEETKEEVADGDTKVPAKVIK